MLYVYNVMIKKKCIRKAVVGMIFFETNALKKNVKFRARGSRENITKILYIQPINNLQRIVD